MISLIWGAGWPEDTAYTDKRLRVNVPDEPIAKNADRKEKRVGWIHF